MISREYWIAALCTLIMLIFAVATALAALQRQFHNPKPLLRLDFLSIEKGVPPQILEVIGDQTDTRERK
ncbi:hypothetical protein, partial [Paenibacillus typhae]|uniref:hypothetical protein n=1 Tax=Paenibacillus typhae TaxID=1174501 RepID=UPI0039EF30C4